MKDKKAELYMTSSNDYYISLTTVKSIDALVEEQEITMYLCNCESYMGLEPPDDSLVTWGADIGEFVLLGSMDILSKTYVSLDDEALSKYNIKIIKKSISPPINPEDYLSDNTEG